jgi:tRNA (guanosine-2'-O-)-methyltransferase
MIQEFPLEPFMLSSRVDRLQKAVAQRTRSVCVVLDGVHDQHNLSAVVRSCEGFGLLDLHVIETHAPFRIGSSVTQGAEKWLDIHLYPQPEDCIASLAATQAEIWLADPAPGSFEVHEVDWQKPIALVFGNEHEGPSQVMQEHATGRFHIPMRGFSQSLNISVAVGITLAIGVAERIKRLGNHGDLSQSEQTDLIAEWQLRSVKCADKILARLNQEKSNKDENIEKIRK